MTALFFLNPDAQCIAHPVDPSASQDSVLLKNLLLLQLRCVSISGFISAMPFPNLTLEELARRVVVLEGLATEDLPSKIKEDLESLARLQGNYVVIETAKKIGRQDGSGEELTPDDHKRALKVADKVSVILSQRL